MGRRFGEGRPALALSIPGERRNTLAGMVIRSLLTATRTLHGRVLVLPPFGGRSRAPMDWAIHLAAQAYELRARGSRVETIFPDSDSRNAVGVNVMDLSTRPPAARAGYNQGRALAEQLTEFWR
jgi:hypothetical protein